MVTPSAAPAYEDGSEVVVSHATSEQEWDAFALAHPGASGYHLWRWRIVFERAFGHDTAYLIARRGATAVGILPLVIFRSRLFGRFAVSLPFVNYGGIVANDEQAADALLARAAAMARERRLAYVELRHRLRQHVQQPCRQHKVAMILALSSSADAIWTTLDRKVRNQIRKAEKSALIADSGGPELIAPFYRVFARNMRDLGTPVYSRRLFDEFFRQFGASARVFRVQHEGATIAAGIAYRHGNTVEVPWASSLVAYRSLCPNHLLYWRVIEWAATEGLRLLDFGRSTPDGGTYHFKQQWGAVAQPLYWEYLLATSQHIPDHGPTNPKFHSAIELWKRLPVWAANTIGPGIVRSIP